MENPRDHVSVLIIGAGPAGYTAAIYAARAGLSPALFTGAQIGGQLLQTTDVENFPGFPTSILGGDLMERMRQQAENLQTRFFFEAVTRVDLSQRPFTCWGEETTVMADAIIIATGSTARWLNIPGEDLFKGYGVSGCATCDGFFYRDKDVAVVGGGNTAVMDALFLTNFARSVTLIHRRDQLRAEKTLQDRLFKNPKVRVIWDTTVEEIAGTEDPKHVTHLVLRGVQTGEISRLNADGVFVAIGHTPQTQWLQGAVETDAEGYICTFGGTTRTSVPGVFASGDVMDPHYQQAITAAGNGCRAALDAEAFLMHGA